MNRFTRNSYPGILCAVVILLLTGLPGSVLPKVKPIFGIDKIVHILMFAGFTFATLWGYRKQYQENGKAYRQKAIWITIVIGITYGILTEVMQKYLIPNRIGSVYDWLADVIGCFLGIGIYYFLYRKRNNLKNEAFRK